jgi:Starch-binding associating with outer membrane/Susd and RagB outer membrane lipoprotein
MKNISKFFTYVLLAAGLVFASCETTELDLLDDPNNVTQDKADLNRFMTQIQLDFASFMRQMGGNDAQLTRINYMFGRTYVNNFQPAVLDGEWATAYQGMFSDMASAELLATENEANKHIGIMRILKAYTLITLVDNFGDVPYSQATNPSEFPAPVADPGASVYEAAIDLLNEGISFLGSPGDNLENDFFYNNDFNKWTKLANSVKMVAYLNTGNTAAFNAASSGAINNSADDFQFQYGSNETNPDTRHPSYSSDYNVSGAGTYESVWLMGTMLDLGDPRIRYYFYRQTGCTPGASCDPDGNQTVLTCSVAPRPTHFPADMLFCSLEDGYWGRDHGNAEGIPPDGFQRTVNGVYPAGGKFDADNFSAVVVGAGGGGAGIMPIMLAAWTDLMRAEVALKAGSAGSAASFITSSLQKHIAKVQSFGNVDPDADSSFFPTAGEVNSYINSVVSSFNSATTDGKWEVLAQQQFISHYGNGIDSYNFYRRTGYPKRVQYNIDPNPGGFVRSFFYPANEANVNSNITQKPNVGVQVFWDNNPPSPGFPVAN